MLFECSRFRESGLLKELQTHLKKLPINSDHLIDLTWDHFLKHGLDTIFQGHSR